LVTDPILQLKSIIGDDYTSLLGTLISFLIFVCLLPSWVEIRWNGNQFDSNLYSKLFRDINRVGSLFIGFLYSLLLILLMLFFVFLFSWGRWAGEITLINVFNALFLFFIVGFAEELIFRFWLYGELTQFFPSFISISLQAFVFSLVHLNPSFGFIQTLTHLISLYLLGIVLSLIRRRDNGSIFGCIGFHGGLVSTWFLLDSGLIEFSQRIPYWFLGISESYSNPISSCFSILSLLLMSIYFFKTSKHSKEYI
tara:strand:+ start:328 stop:1086 length:759 start_codon:yes stop_codon:yes gene_type:complete